MFLHWASEEVRTEEVMPLITHLGSQISEHLWSSLVQEEESHPSLLWGVARVFGQVQALDY